MDQLTILEMQDVIDRQEMSGLLRGYEPSDPAWQKRHCEGTLKGRWVETDQGGYCVSGPEKEEMAKKERCKMPPEFSCPKGAVFNGVTCTCDLIPEPVTPWWPWAVAGAAALVALLMAARKR